MPFALSPNNARDAHTPHLPSWGERASNEAQGKPFPAASCTAKRVERAGLAESPHPQQLEARRRTLPKPTEGESHAVEWQVDQACFGASTMAVVLQEPGPHWSLLFTHQGEEEGIGEARPS